MHQALASLLTLLDDRKPGSSVTSVVNATAIGRICYLLSTDPKDYAKIAEQLSETSDVNNMLDFLLFLVCNGYLSNVNATSSDTNWRARRLMMKVITKMPVIPTSLIVTGITMPAERDYIGGGGYGHVYKGELGGTTVALKVLYKADNSVAFCREALMWGSLKHKFVLPFLGIYESEGGTMPQFFLVSPFMENGTLAQWRKKVNPSITKIEACMMEVAQGIEYIHSEGVIHGDLRGDNVFLDANFHVQIADFGLTRLSDATATRSGALHLNFAAPELFDSAEDDDDDAAVRTQKSDVYAFGCLYYEIHYDMMPFAGKTDMQILKLISRGMRPPRCDEPPLNDDIWELIQWCWAQEALERPGMRNAVEWIIAILAQSSTDSAPMAPPYHWPATQSHRLENEHENDSESLSFVVPTAPRRSSSAPTPPPYQEIQIPNIYMPSPPLLPMINRRPSQTGRDFSAYIPTEGHLVPPQPLDQPGQSGAFSTNDYHNIPDQPSLRTSKLQPPTLSIISPTPRAFTFATAQDSPYSSPSHSPFEPDLSFIHSLSQIPRTLSPDSFLRPSSPIQSSQVQQRKRRKSSSTDVQRWPRKGDENYIKRPKNAIDPVPPQVLREPPAG